MTISIFSISLLFLAMVISLRVNALGQWNEVPIDINFIDGRDGCLGNGCGSMRFPDKRGSEVGEMAVNPQRVSRGFTSRRILEINQCRCETQYELMDLGINHYPRYLSAARCVSHNCNIFYPCRGIYYKVYILHPRETSLENEELEQTHTIEQALPDILHRNWQMKGIEVPVACGQNDRK